MNLKRYIINYTKLVAQRIPLELTFPEVTAYVMALITPIVNTYNNLLLFREQIIYKLTITPQVVYLEKMLNDRYDSIERRIYIWDGAEYLPRFLFVKAELKPDALYRKSEVTKPKLFLYTKGEVGQFTYDFVVYVPLVVTFDANEMAALVSTYKLASKLFKIQTF
jgi:hypothetical protein